MEKDDVCINCSVLCRLKTGLAVSGFGGAVWGIPSPSFPPSLQSHPSGSLLLPWFPTSPQGQGWDLSSERTLRISDPGAPFGLNESLHSEN